MKGIDMDYNTIEIAMRIAMWINKWDSDPHTGYDNQDYWMDRMEQDIESVYEDIDAYGDMLSVMTDGASDAEYFAILDDINELAIVME